MGLSTTKKSLSTNKINKSFVCGGKLAVQEIHATGRYLILQSEYVMVEMPELR
jgi:hypothetical protein